VHDFHPGIAPSGLYWVLPVPDSALTVSADGSVITLAMEKVPVIDQPRWPAMDATATPATMSFRMVWTATDEAARYDDPSKHFLFTGKRATCQMEAEVNVPSMGFSWKSDPLSTSRCDFAIMGDEVNGRYYDMPRPAAT
jgi:hypothetical protein